jgi:type II secretory pathway pseudopilin PulG
VTAGLGSGRRARARRTDPVAVERAREQGFTLVETLITVWIMDAIMVALIGALFTMTRASDIARKRTLGEAALRDFEEAVQEYPYQPCAFQTGHGDYSAAYPRNLDATLTSVSLAGNATIITTFGSPTFWDPTLGSDPTQPSSFVNASTLNVDNPQDCTPSAASGDAGAQKIQLNVQVMDPGTGNIILLLSQVVDKRDEGLHP